jgi:hypothetical protein
MASGIASGIASALASGIAYGFALALALLFHFYFDFVILAKNQFSILYKNDGFCYGFFFGFALAWLWLCSFRVFITEPMSYKTLTITN